MISVYHDTSAACSKIVTQKYSTSFSMGIRAFSEELHEPIYSIYGFVRLADEIVDSFHDHNKEELFDRFRKDTYTALIEGISLNPVLHAFQRVALKYNIGLDLIDPFFDSMEMDLFQKDYEENLYREYIFGSAEVVGLMCLKVFCNGNYVQYENLKGYAQSLGAAFQKVNFLRDIKSDFQERGRTYFPGIDFNSFDEDAKCEIEKDIYNDFQEAYKGIKQLPKSARLGVYLAYVYYLNLFKKIRSCSASHVTKTRIRISDANKVLLWLSSALKVRLNLV